MNNPLIQELQNICKELRAANFDQSVADTGNWAAHTAASMIEEAIQKHIKKEADNGSSTNS